MFIMTTGAALRLLSAATDDPLAAWIEADRVRPFICPTTLALVRHEIFTAPEIDAAARAVLIRRYDRLEHDLRNEHDGSVTEATFDLRSARILADILVIDAGQDALSDMDLVPAAIAIQHNLTLVVAENIEAWQALAGDIHADLGVLALEVFLPLQTGS